MRGVPVGRARRRDDDGADTEGVRRGCAGWKGVEDRIMTNFAAQFEAAGGGPIEYQGLQLYAWYEMPVSKGDKLQVSLVRFAKRGPRQAMRVTCRGRGQMEINGVVGRDFVLWADTLKRIGHQAKITVLRPGRDGMVIFQNMWEDPKYGTFMYGLGCSSVQICDEPEGTVLRCSDGSCPPDFDDLVLTIKRE